MKFFLKLSFFIALSFLSGIKSEETTLFAKCVLEQNLNSGVSGDISFSQETGKNIKINGAIKGLADGKHGFHIHEKAVTGNDCNSTGAHFNPDNVNHAGHTDAIRHAGDLGNVDSSNKEAKVDITDDKLSLDKTSKYYIIGKSCVVHESVDDLGKGEGESKINGNAGKRFGCGTIIEATSGVMSILSNMFYVTLIAYTVMLLF